MQSETNEIVISLKLLNSILKRPQQELSKITRTSIKGNFFLSLRHVCKIAEAGIC